MTVVTLSYLLFILVLWSLAWLIRAPKARQLLFLLASYVFYASWSPIFLLVLLVSTFANFAVGNWLRRKPTLSRLWVGIGFNLFILCIFKYLPALIQSSTSGGRFQFLHSLIMPVGISFWTFQALSYLFDLYREEELDPSLLEFCLYLSFWPTVLAGPVSRLTEMLPQFREAAAPRWEDISEGVQRIITGLFMKLVLSEILLSGLNPGEGLTTGFDQMNSGWGGLDVWMLAMAYGFQLFFDFAGYSHIVIGSALLFGIRLPENFDRPYFSTTPSMFWTRWHMSLSFWIRDYVFMPLATVRRQAWWRHAALVFAMVFFGLWHGATWLFLIWGAYHGLLLVGHRQLQLIQRHWKLKLPDALTTPISWGITLALISLGWIFFRGHDLHQVLEMFAAVFSPHTYFRMALRPNFYIVTSLIVGGSFVYYFLAGFMTRLQEHPWSRRLLWLLSPARYAAIILLTVIWSKQEAVFVYFQF